jgi:hypothetical protein
MITFPYLMNHHFAWRAEPWIHPYSFFDESSLRAVFAKQSLRRKGVASPLETHRRLAMTFPFCLPHLWWCPRPCEQLIILNADFRDEKDLLDRTFLISYPIILKIP